MRRLTITVIGDALADVEQYEFSEQVGRLLAELNAIVVTGGRGGVMEAVSKGVQEGGGLSIGILPGDNRDEANPYCDVVIPTGLGHARNAMTAMTADIVIVIGGQAGTLTEMGFSWIYHKPILAVTRFGGWAAGMAGKKIDQRRQDAVIGIDDLEQLRNEIIRIARLAGSSIQ